MILLALASVVAAPVLGVLLALAFTTPDCWQAWPPSRGDLSGHGIHSAPTHKRR